jgi:type IV pilus assembly protein PilW
MPTMRETTHHHLAVRPLRTRHARRHALGRSLIELMIVLLISLIVMGAVILTVSGTSLTGEQQDAQARLNEDAAVAAHLLTSQLRLGGYTVVTSKPNAKTHFKPGNYTGPPVIGCEGGFAAVGNLNNNTCNGGGNQPDAITVFFEADAFNTTPNVAGGPPTDCLGRNIPNVVVQSNNPPYPLASNRYYIGVDNTGVSGLYCYGAGGGVANGMLVPNVIDLNITYGLASYVPGAHAPGTSAVSYLRADQINALPLPARPVGFEYNLTNWDLVVSIRVCMVIQSDLNAVPSNTGRQFYLGCRGNVPIDNNDTRLYRTIDTVVALRNKTAPCLRSSVVQQDAADNITLCSPT